MARSRIHNEIAARLRAANKLLFSAVILADIEHVLSKARQRHSQAKQYVEQKIRQGDLHTQGGARGMSHSAYDNFDYMLRTWLAKYLKSRNPEIRTAAKNAYAQIETMRDYWLSQYDKYS